MIGFLWTCVKLAGLLVLALVFTAGLVCGLAPRWITRKALKHWPDSREAVIVGALSGLSQQAKVEALTNSLIALGMIEIKQKQTEEVTYKADQFKRRLWN